jgi:hypothetical protein
MSYKSDAISKGVSIVVPVFNEEESVSLLYKNIKDFVPTLKLLMKLFLSMMGVMIRLFLF